jgi:hypothetical protein
MYQSRPSDRPLRSRQFDAINSRSWPIGARRIDAFPQAILEHIVLLMDIRIYVAIHAKEPGVVYARINHAETASDAGVARGSDLLDESGAVRALPSGSDMDRGH